MSIKVCSPTVSPSANVLTPEALALIGRLHRTFGPMRTALLQERMGRPGLLPETEAIRSGDWRVDPPEDRRLSPLLDLEDGVSPAWASLVGTLASLVADPAPVLRPRALHLDERRVLIGGQPIAASLLDVGLYLHHAAARLLATGRAPCLSLPKLESHQEARFWQRVLNQVEAWLGLPPQRIRVLLRIETVSAAFQVEEILFELRNRTDGLSACLPSYLSSLIRAFPDEPAFLLPEQERLTPNLPALQALTERLGQTCERRGARPLPCHTGLLADPLHLRANPEEPPTLLTPTLPTAPVSEEGLRSTIRLTRRHLAAWLRGAPLKTDGATAELARSLLWQWVRHGVRVEGDGPRISPALVRLLAQEERGALEEGPGAQLLFDQLIFGDRFVDHFAVPGYHYLD